MPRDEDTEGSREFYYVEDGEKKDEDLWKHALADVRVAAVRRMLEEAKRYAIEHLGVGKEDAEEMYRLRLPLE